MNELVISLFEQQTISYKTLGLAENAPLLTALEQVNELYGAEIFRLGRNDLHTKQYVGVVQVEGITIQILPKIDYELPTLYEQTFGSRADETSSASAAHNFLNLLALVGRLKVHSPMVGSLRTSRGTWLDMLTWFFATELYSQLQQGFHQDFVWKEDYLSFVVPGKIHLTSMCW